jgi:hypothetical protein
MTYLVIPFSNEEEFIRLAGRHVMHKAAAM